MGKRIDFETAAGVTTGAVVGVVLFATIAVRLALTGVIAWAIYRGVTFYFTCG